MQENHHNLILEELNRLQSLVEQVLNLNTALTKEKEIDSLNIEGFATTVHARMMDMKSLIEVKEHGLKTELQKLEQKILDLEESTKENTEEPKPITLPESKDSSKKIRRLSKEIENLNTALEDKNAKLHEDLSDKIYLLSKELRNEIKAMYAKLEASMGFQEVEKRIKYLHDKINAISRLSSELGGFEKVLELVTRTLKELQTEMAKYESLKKEILSTTQKLAETKKEMELLREETNKTEEKLELMNRQLENLTQNKKPQDNNSLYLWIGIIISLSIFILSLTLWLSPQT